MPGRRFNSSLEAPEFRNREEQLAVIAGHADAVHSNPAHFKVLEVLGFGGMGKTSLLEKSWTAVLEARSADQLLWVSLEGEGATNATGPLLAMRDQLEFECLLFDTALVAYWNAMGQSLQLGRSGRLSSSLPVKALEAGGGFAGFALPIGFGLQVFETIKRAATKRSHYRLDEFEEIERLHKRPDELLRHLPRYLALDLKRRIELDGEWVLVFYDAYDRQRVSTREENAPWMQEFIRTLEQGVHVISTREPLRWDQNEWGDVLAEVHVEALPDTAAREMLRAQLGELAAPIEERLLSASHRIPFLLDTVINGYMELAKRGGPIAVDELPSSPESAVEQFLAHLPEAQRELAIGLASAQVFDEPLYRHIVDSLNAQVSYASFGRFLDWYFVEAVPPSLHKTHDLLTGFVRGSPRNESVSRLALEAATGHLLARCLDEQGLKPDEVLPIFRAVLAGWHSTKDMPTKSIEALIDVGFLVYDAGYWNELASIGSEGSREVKPPAGVISELFLALTARRTVGMDIALDRFTHLMPRSHLLGRHHLSVELEAAYVRGLAGDYAYTREEFRRLAEKANPFDPSDRTQRRARLYQGGMLLMDGAFQESSRLLLETYEAIDPRATSDWGELVRYRGHAHRFSFALEQAEALYLRAISSTEAENSPALMGRLQTNLAETYCWCDPHGALRAAEGAAQIHATLGNRIELAKCDTARGIALAKMHDFEGARQVIGRAIRLAEAVGYEGGIAFALQARVIAEWLAGSHDEAKAACDQLSEIIEDMGTYRHLLVAPRLLLGDTAAFVASAKRAEWLEDEQVEDRMAAYLAPD